MSFLNINNSIITNSYGDLYNFQTTKEGIQVIIHNRQSANTDKKIVVEGKIIEYDVAINNEDEIYFICQKEDTSISIYKFDNSEWTESKIAGSMGNTIYNLKLLIIDDEVNMFYSIPKSGSSDKVSIYHHYLHEDKWITNLVDDIARRKIINNIEATQNNDDILLGYYDSVGDHEEVFFKVYDRNTKVWGEKVQITNSGDGKLYLDLLHIDGFLHIVYSKFNDENLIIEHNKIDRVSGDFNLIYQNTLSGWANCSYPTLMYDNEKLWVIWTEYDNVMSAYSIDNGDTWTNPYLWKGTKGVDFLRYKFATNEDFLKNNFITKYSFGKDYPELTLLGFGNLDDAVESVKKKDGHNDKGSYPIESDVNEVSELQGDYQPYDDNTYYNYNDNNNDNDLDSKIKSLEDKLDSINSQINDLQNQIKNINSGEIGNISERVEEIESYLNRRRNPFIQRI